MYLSKKVMVNSIKMLQVANYNTLSSPLLGEKIVLIDFLFNPEDYFEFFLKGPKST